MSESEFFSAVSVHGKAASELLGKASSRLMEMAEFSAFTSNRCGEGREVVRHLHAVAEIELRRAEESLGRLRQKVQQLAVERVLDQCS